MKKPGQSGLDNPESVLGAQGETALEAAMKRRLARIKQKTQGG